MMRIWLIAALLVAGPAAAVDHAALAARALDRHVLPGFETLAADTEALSEAAGATCDGAAPEPLRAAYDRAFDAWMGIAHLRFGPLEEGEAGFAIAFWPDTRGATPRTLAALEASADPVVDDPAAFGRVSVAGRGLFALDALLETGAPAPGDYRCRLLVAVARDLAATAATARDRWRDPYAGYFRSAGAPDNPLFFSADEPTRALYTALVGGLQATADLRLGRPLGTFEKPQPRRAEAWRTGRPQRNVVHAIGAAQSLFDAAFAPELMPEANARITSAFEAALVAAEAAGSIEIAVGEPGGRLRVEAAQQAIERLLTALAAEIGPSLGIAGGFNSMDGD